MTQNTRVDETVVQHGADSGGFRSSPVVDWVVALFLTMTGLVFAFGGYLLYAVADRSWIAGRVADGTITSTELTDAELVDVTYALAWGSGIGLAATGIILVAAGVAFLVLRARARRRAQAGSERRERTDCQSTPDRAEHAPTGVRWVGHRKS